jgi:hypothetical protein
VVVEAVEPIEKALIDRIGARVRLFGIRGIGTGPLELSRILDAIDGVGDGNRPGKRPYCDEDPHAIGLRRMKCRYGHGEYVQVNGIQMLCELSSLPEYFMITLLLRMTWGWHMM